MQNYKYPTFPKPRMRVYPEPQPKPSRTGLKIGIVVGVLVLFALLTVVAAGISFVTTTFTESRSTSARGQEILAYAEDVPESSEAGLAKLQGEMTTSREMYPEVASYEKLLAGRAQGSNGWVHLEAGADATNELYAHEGSLEGLAVLNVNLYDGERESFAEAEAQMSATRALPQHVLDCLAADSVFPLLYTRDSGPSTATTPYLNEFLDICLSRVVVMFAQGRDVEAVSELMPLVELCSRCHDDRNRATAEWWNAYRNRVLKVGVLGPLNAGKLSIEETKRIIAFRWTTNPNDRNIWLNNLADVMARYQWAIDNDSTEHLPNRDDQIAFSKLPPWDLNAYAFHVKTARDHVEDSDNGSLDMSSDSYLADYLEDYAENELLDLADG